MVNMKMDNETCVLLVDDEPLNRRLLTDILCDKYLVLSAECGRDALDCVAAHPEISLVILDVMMPEMDGYTVVQLLKSHEAFRDIPVIFITALNDAANETHGLELGAVDYIAKPFSRDVVLARVRTHIELAATRKALEKIGQERHEMLHILCHDLTNPLCGIAGALDIIDDPEELMSYKNVLASQARHGLAIIDLVRSMQAVESGKLVIDQVNLLAALNESKSMLHLKSEAKNIQMDWQVDPNLWVLAETTSLVNSVLNNIITNAIKFCAHGGHIKGHAVLDQQYVKLTISDDGVGIPPALLEILFSLNKCTSRPGTDGESGTGFGMPLVRKFMHAYGGEIHVRSTECVDPSLPHGTDVELVFCYDLSP